jgi:hypothetical protein
LHVSNQFLHILNMRYILILFAAFSFLQTHGQSADVTRLSATASDSVAALYFYNQKDELAIYNGRLFYGYSALIEGNAFYPISDWQNASILYDDIWYHNIQALYNTYTDELIVRHPSGLQVGLHSEKIKEFRLGEKVFIRLIADEKQTYQTGFYERLQDGKAILWARRVKLLEEKIVDMQVERKFVKADKYYLFNNRLFHSVWKQKKLVSLLNDSPQKINQYIRQESFNYKDNREAAMMRIVSIYNQLQH